MPALPAHFDQAWKIALDHAFQAFVAFFYPQLYALIDWSKRPRFRDKELSQVGFGDTPATRLADKLVSVRLADGSEQWVMVHVEVQSQVDESLPLRVLEYNFRIFERYKCPVASLVLLADDRPDWHPHAFHNSALGTVMGISFTTAKLLDFADRTDQLLVSRNPFALLTLAQLQTRAAHGDPAELFAAKWQLTQLLYQRGWSKRRIIALFKAINWMMTLPEHWQERYWQHIRELEGRNAMELLNPLEQWFFDKGHKQGLQEGLQKGLLEGREKGAQLERDLSAVQLLERMLDQRFGPLSDATREQLHNASLDQLLAWGDALASAKSIDEILARN